MQKKLLTLAVAGALAAPGLALAQVEVYGFVNLSVGKWKYSEPTQGAGAPGNGVGSVSKWDITSAASNVGVRARENVGGGNTAWMQIETNAGMERSNNIANTSGFASRNSAVGMQGGWGNLFIGQWTTPWADLDALWGIGTVGGLGPVTSIIGRRETTGAAPNPNCANTGSGLGSATACESVEGAGGIGHPFWRRASNSLHYQSPVMAGVQVKFMYQTNQDKATPTTPAGAVVAADPSMYSASATWAGMGGRVRVGAAVDGHKEFTTQGQTDSGVRITGGWNFGFMDIGLAWEQMSYKSVAGDCDAEQMGIGIAIPVGQGAIRGSYSIAKDIEGTYSGGVVAAPSFGAASCGAAPTATFNASDNGAKQWNLGYEYRFSKRTTVGFGYAMIDNDQAAFFTWSGAPSIQNGLATTPLAGSDPSSFFVNMIHRF